ncbi:MAG: glycosyltransferase involved in cell wall biosynthesis [Bacteroidia bacterium]|jgi:glycosyltransferase involved in cell wall biosynthesis
MKVLQLCHKPPYPKNDGGCIAIASISEAFLNQDIDLRILTVTTHKHSWIGNAWPDQLKGITKHVQINTNLKPVSALKSLFGSGSYNVDRFFSEEFESQLEDQISTFNPDVIWLESLFMTPYIDTIRRKSKAKIILRAHNVEFKIWERLSANSASILKKPYLSFLSKRMKEYELNAIQKVDGIAALSFEDEKFFKSLTKAEVKLVPIGIDLDQFSVPTPSEPLTLFHLGDMNWGPNEEAINFFATKVWPLVAQSTPKAKCILAGRNMPNSLMAKSGEGLQIMGDVEDSQMFFKENDILVLPLLSGGGMRVKMLEAMAKGKVVITTTVGAEGIRGKNGEHFIIANEAQSMANEIDKVYQGKYDLAAIGTAARKLVEEHFSNTAISKELNYFCQRLAGLNR